MKLELDRVPISVNHAYYFKRFGNRTIKIKTTKAKEFFNYVKSKVVEKKLIKLFLEPVDVRITIFFDDKRRRDIENYTKIMLDALTGLFWKDDSQIYHLVLRKAFGKERTIIEVKPYESSVLFDIEII